MPVVRTSKNQVRMWLTRRPSAFPIRITAGRRCVRSFSSLAAAQPKRRCAFGEQELGCHETPEVFKFLANLSKGPARKVHCLELVEA